ncbi:putative signal transduction histidine kinase [Leptothrix cholodnii SP-6]|uniref:Putative signal transduction histidine kinase n=2 Tax=Leptothrix cholodnii TaxID=34029 RepID=B1XWI6_LEPCP|nr:putative signal transduction histidine kinase [Leptothrix cholodnii SP-6]
MLPEALFDSLVEPVLVFDAGAGLRYVNPAALRHLHVEVGMSLADLRSVFDTSIWQWLNQAIGSDRSLVQPPRSADGRPLAVLSRLDERHWALCLPLESLRLREQVPVLQIADGPLRHVHAMLWGAPFPAMLQDESFRILDVNAAFLTLAGGSRERLIGHDPLGFQPPADHAETLADRERLMRDPLHPDVPALVEQRLIDSDGQVRWVRAARYVTLTQDGRHLLLTLMQETTAEHAARDQAERYSRELDQWFDRSPLGMALFDPGGLVLRANQVFEQLVGGPLVEVREASPEVRALLAWRADQQLMAVEPDAHWAGADGSLPQADGGARWVRALLRSYEAHEGRGGPRRIMCMLEDRTAEAERDLAVARQQLAQAHAEQLLADLSTILESSPAGIASMRGYTLVQCNRRFEHMLRLAPGAGVGRDIRTLLASHVQGDAWAEGLEHDTLHEAELEVPDDDGQRHWYALSIRRTGPAGDAPQAIAVVSEITRLKAQQAQLETLAHEREQMAQVLGQQADRNRAVLDSVLVGIVTVNEQGVISWLNRSARRMFGGDLGDFLGRAIDAVATDEPLHPFRRSLELLDELRDGEALMFECRVQGRDGRTFWVVGNVVNTLGAHGRRELMFALMDIEQRRQAEARVAEARASLQRIIEAAPMAITLCDANSLAVLQINRAAAELCGVAAEAAVGCRPEQLFSPAAAQRLREDVRVAMASPEQVTQREYRWQRGAVAQVWDARFLPLARPGERVDQILLVASDVTAQRAAQQAELEAAIAQREMLVQEVHHRIKNNLQGVVGLMQQIATRRPEVQPVIAEVVGQVQAIAQVYGLQVGNIGPLRFRNVMSAIAQSVERTFGRTIELRVDDHERIDWALPESESIPIALTLNELLTNAIKHSPAGSTVGCRLVADPGGVRIEIGNLGSLPPGFRIDHRPSTVSGLGLVRALLPRRNASLGIEQRDDRVVAIVALAAPVVTRLPPPARVA